MRLGLDARYVYDHFPGIGRYVVHLAHALADLPHNHTLVLLSNPALPNTRHDLTALRQRPNVEFVETTARPFAPGEYRQIPALARALRLDMLHSPYYLKPYGGLPCPSVVTIYDLIGRRFPHALPWRGRWLFNVATGLAVHTAQRILTISASARDDVAHYYGIPKDRIVVTHLAADERFCPQPPAVIEAVRAKYGLPARYVLYLGANKPHKNLGRLVAAWAGLEAGIAGHLVIAGHYDPRYPAVQRLVTAQGLSTRVHFLPNVAEHDLPALYSGAVVFAFPSYYEGFGLPPLEAMACGTPVVCANTSSLPEVVGDAAMTVDPYRVDKMRAALHMVLDNPSLHDYLRQRGIRQAARFSWTQTARVTLAVYESVVQRSRS